jgi:hypothetical protein
MKLDAKKARRHLFNQMKSNGPRGADFRADKKGGREVGRSWTQKRASAPPND